MNGFSQSTLSTEQIEAFHHDEFVEEQVRDFRAMLPANGRTRLVVDVGGGCGYFARCVRDLTGAVGHCRGAPEKISPPLRGLLIKTIRRDSYVLEAPGTERGDLPIAHGARS